MEREANYTAVGAFVILVFIVTLTRLGGAGVSGAP